MNRSVRGPMRTRGPGEVPQNYEVSPGPSIIQKVVQYLTLTELKRNGKQKKVGQKGKARGKELTQPNRELEKRRKSLGGEGKLED